ncbi:MAG TPA: hypothetical protein VNR39_18840 [Pseudolabrys sp.]|nr:hypothetical protein [Pseudolabrys sp.]
MQIAKRQIGIQFGWNGSQSAQQNLQTQRARVSKYLGNTQSALSSIGSALAGAATNKISGLATIAAQRAADRIQAQAKTAWAAREQELANAQALLDTTRQNYNAATAASSAVSSTTGNVLNTSA